MSCRFSLPTAAARGRGIATAELECPRFLKRRRAVVPSCNDRCRRRTLVRRDQLASKITRMMLVSTALAAS